MSEVSARVYPSTVVVAVTRRYGDAYIVARTIDGLGETIKIIGVVIGALLALGSFITATKGGMATALGLVGIAIAATIGTVLYLLGTLASAQGQILKATLDTAVNSSQFLQAPDRAQVMSLPYAAPTVAGALVDLSPQSRSEWRCGCGQLNPAGTSACLECGVHRGAA